ncbi:M10 family metallopeptidase C-terminal domain-containing protein [Bradyrhizobium yuanmingense]|uniref:M10 family metallopeptidase C-terminal domain-containing protein n=1 Tax=Bradyrhizobium yuanmingense TaxID=108015 RepID=UPI0023B9167D|nr:M10 family metallopeptidase C-terminal domain-containing protein [Bradyrhizobium yuanmingense]MDF0583812.1 M10 family metallopeptidase C-terminal domain-containing protein [Bradyrhizobium yuanmingense]
MATAVYVSATNNAEIDGLLSGVKWSGTITYSFPDAPSDYSNPYSGGSGEPITSGFASVPTQIQAAINYAVGLILSYTNANIQYAGTNGADLMIAQSPAANPTAYAYYPGNYAPGGDIWFGTQYNFSLAKLGNYYFTTALHELGHAIGLKHSQEAGGPANVAVPSAHDSSEYTVMSYRSYVGASTTGGYTNEAYGYSQTYMANDILALQTMYGADYTTQSGSTIYTWNPTTGQLSINGVSQLAPGGGTGGSANRIYETIWDGGGIDTYDLSNYTTNLSINLNPGASSVFSSVQLAYLGDGHYASGNVYNAYLYNGDARSYIDNATGGSGNDTIVGNAIANTLNGGGGNDRITGGGGNDTVVGGAGTDTAIYSGSQANYTVTYDATTQIFTLADLRGGSPDGTDAVTGVEYFQFDGGTLSSAALISLLAPVMIETTGATSLVMQGSRYFLNPVGGGTGPELKYGGSAVVSGQFNPWMLIGAEVTATGYQVAWKQPGTDYFTIWNTDNAGNYLGNPTGIVRGTDSALESLEPSFHQDLNGDGFVGIPAGAVVESRGTTSLVLAGNNYYLNSLTGVTGPKLCYNGVAVVSGQFSPWALIGAEQTSGGFEIAFKQPGTNYFTIWNTDSAGNYLGNPTGIVLGTSSALENLEPSFQQDLNGDGVIGLLAASPGTVIESYGSTSLVAVGSKYYLNPISGGVGRELKYNGVSVIDGQFSPWTLVGAEETAEGFQIAFKQPGTSYFTVWKTDTAGNYLANPTGIVLGTSSALENFEPSFHQDLNGDGLVGPPAVSPGTVIESYGSTSLVAVSSNYYLNPIGGGVGPELKYNGVPVVTDQFSPWTLIGAEETADGFQIAFKQPGTSYFTIWKTDSAGNYLGNPTGIVLGTSPVLESFELSFHQDLNGDGISGVPAATPLAVSQSSHNFQFDYFAAGVEMALWDEKGGADINISQAVSGGVGYDSVPFSTQHAQEVELAIGDQLSVHVADPHGSDFIIR